MPLSPRTILFSTLLALLIPVYAQVPASMTGKHPDIREIVIMEVLQTTSYTYVRAAEKNRVIWMACPKMEATKGEKYYYHDAVEMRDFKSKELDRVFPSVWFVNELVDPELLGKGDKNSRQELTDSEEKIVPAEGSVQIAELYRDQEKYRDQHVRVTGRVTRVNEKIMGRNWIHLEDSSTDKDITITSSLKPEKGEVLTMEGELRVNKDFGAGYVYEIIIEKGEVVTGDSH